MTALAGRSTRFPELAGLVASRIPGRCLPAPFYTDPAIHDADVAGIFARHWIFVATEPEVSEPGDYVTVEIGPYSVIIVRDDDEQIRAWHNVCRHRGARILPEANGSVGNIVCGYHKWTYSPDGVLLSAGEQPPDFDKGCFGLKPVQLRNVAGLIYLCLADDPPADFDEVIPRIEPYLAPHRLEHTKVAAQVDLVEPGNWKLVMENNRECYHCDGHPELLCSFFPTYGYEPDDMPARLQPAFDRFLQADLDLRNACDERGMPHALIEELSGRPTGFRIQREALDGAGESFTRDGRAACQRLLADFDTPRLGRMTMHQQPNVWLHLLSDHAVTFSVLPIAADQTLVRTTWLVHEDAVEGEDYDVAALTDVWRATNEQDRGFVRLAQQGVSSPAYEPGPYSASEYQVEQFCAWYIERMTQFVQS
ncbi:aromatic ring-hydroxylating oxygenase subunit alpha [Segeticoccus rhizosphaerae]|uniref:aromatic ring-hydroxylating oxygenase subunit alpha n=1 Tax=Segeticoccus rhizosphaerae TaxID=1104777 RepID=UPI0010C0E541|nr:aromatic ring-hydroxylating dioxygenase subunit alpha [Ornithinicoccus soli]